jgi:FKBP-type peptidyl-prolyl cis-trans isomerase
VKKYLIWGALTVVAVSPVIAQDAAPAAGLQSEAEKVSYVLGAQFGRSLRSQYIDVDMKSLTKGIEDASQDKPLAMKPEEMRKVLSEYQPKLAAKQQQIHDEAATKNQGVGEKFLVENAKKPGVKTTASGLQYLVVKDGAGPTPKASDMVKTNYRGTFIDGKQFDSSYDRGEPAEFPVGGVISAWKEALQLMKVGSQWKLFVPAKLAYGEQGFPPDIPPNSTLLFDIELLEIVSQPATINVPVEPNAQPGAPPKRTQY